ncbi:MAG: DUF192 domain-containing protein [Bdellovibrionota bacterium]
MRRLITGAVSWAFVLTTLFPCNFASAQARARSEPSKVDFSKRKITLGGKTVTVEIADTPLRRERGLMFRTSLDEKSGMLFVFDGEQPLAFWMKNTLIPLSIAYIDKDRKIVDIQEMVPAVMGEMHPKSYPSKRPAMYALEMPKDWFSRNRVKIGQRFSFAEETSKGH